MGQGGAGLCGKDGAGVAQCVKVQVGSSSCPACLVERLPKGAGVHVSTGKRGEQQRTSADQGVLLQVLLDLREDVRGDVHVSDSDLRLGCSHGRLAIWPGHPAADPDDSLAKVYVGSPQFGYLAVPESAPGTQ